MSSSLSADFWNDVVDGFWAESMPIIEYLIEALVSGGQVVGDVPLDNDVARVQTMMGLQQSGAADMLTVVNNQLATQMYRDASHSAARLMGIGRSSA